MQDLDPENVADLDQAHAAMSSILDELVTVARERIAEHGPERGALNITGHLQIDPGWTPEVLAGVLGMALARLAVTS